MQLFEFTLEPIERVKAPQVLELSAEADAEPPAPPDAPIQDILFQPRDLGESESSREEDSMVLSFVMSDPHVAIRMKRAVRDVYAMYGSAGLISLEAGIMGNPGRPWNLKGEPYHHLKDEPVQYVWSDAENRAIPQFVYTKAPFRLKLGEHYKQERTLLEGLVKKAQDSVESAALTVAQERLGKSRKQVLDETKRYLGLAGSDDKTAAAALDSSSLDWPLTGPDILPLATAILRIDEGRKPINQAEEEYRRISEPVVNKRAEWLKSRIMLLRHSPPSPIPIAEQARAAFPDTEEMIEARDVVAEKEVEFAALVAAEAQAFPILYRLWDSSAARFVRQALSRSRPTNFRQDQIALTNSLELRSVILSTIRRAWNAINRTRKRIENKALNTWRYPSLVTAALQRLAIPPGTIEWMAANDRAEQEEDVSLLSSLSIAASFFELGLALLGAAPPVAAAAAVISLLLFSLDWVVDLLQTLEEQDAFDSSLNPAQSFAAEPSYVGSLVSLAFLVLAVRGTGKTLSKAIGAIEKGGPVR